jgi:shikimate kinase
VIEEREKQTLAAIIARKGLETFLDVEALHLSGLTCTAHVIATGGSVVYREKAMESLAGIATIVYLHVPLSVLMSRLSNVVSRGVAMAPGKGIDDLYKERSPLYDKYGDIRIDCGTLTPPQVVEAVLRCI